MLSVKEKGTLLFIIDHCKRIEKVTSNITEEEFHNNLDIKELSCFHIMQIGEHAKRLPQEFISKYNNVPWKKIKGMRDVIVHGYGKILEQEVWFVVSEDILPLHEYCQSIIDSDK